MTLTEEKPVQKASTPQTLRAEGTSGKKSSDGKHPVLLYIMILFVAAFLLMGLSFLSSQHRNSQALGELQNSVSALQEMQNSQDKLLQMQQQLYDLERANEKLTSELESSSKQAAALQALNALQLKWLQLDLDGCRKILDDMADRDLASALPKSSDYGTTAPAKRYEELKNAITNAVTTVESDAQNEGELNKQ